MRYIPLLESQPEQDWQKLQPWIVKADDLLQQLKDAPNDDARKIVIKNNEKFWGNFKEQLLLLSHNKCWFSEAKDCISHWEVEHFRPKKSAKDIDGTEQMGYWWLAFDWRNFRICGNVPNRKKGTYFPLREGCQRVGLDGDLRMEHPILLDPADPDDPNLISFDSFGNAIVPSDCNDPWDTERVIYSIERYSLNDYPPLVDKRKVVWNECWRRIQQYLYEEKMYQTNKSPTSLVSLKEQAKQIRAMFKATEEFSSVAKACVLSTGIPRIVRFLQSD
jgi:hypothetical protein